ncbi:MAG: hypothetical protein V7739_05095 [Motiliproteus sp.]
MRNRSIHSESDTPVSDGRQRHAGGHWAAAGSPWLRRSNHAALLLVLPLMSAIVQAEDAVIPYAEVTPDYIELEPDSDIEIKVDNYSDPTVEYRDRQFDPVEADVVIDQSFFTEIAVDHVEIDPQSDIEINADGYSDPTLEYRDRQFEPVEQDIDVDQRFYSEVAVDRVEAIIKEVDFPQVKPDSFSGGLFDGRTVYRDMGDRYDAEPMVVVLPAADPELELPPPTVVSVDGYAADESTVIPVDVVSRRVLAKEDEIFEFYSSDPEPPAEVKSREPKSKGRVVLPPPEPSIDSPLIEIITTE